MNATLPSWQVRLENPADAQAVDALNADSFGPGRFAKSAYRLREGVDPIAALSFVAVEKDILRGSVRFWPISVGGHEELLLGPLAVQTGQRGKGIGKLMIAHAKAVGNPLTVDVNEQNLQGVGFYRHMGFVETGRSETDDQGRPYPLLHLQLANSD